MGEEVSTLSWPSAASSICVLRCHCRCCTSSFSCSRGQTTSFAPLLDTASSADNMCNFAEFDSRATFLFHRQALTSVCCLSWV